ncbi:MAG: hypothetical protein HLUCCX14_07565 [Marinobacter excellens HL-55]|uniref:Uncharacterized protein n=1 Tax=Marinobacter excellens HL-55 TaxID=1305731 RepID=A0A0P7Z450_9GAMM|nr:MAG: hypothetical protein HLUCCX14_07565 [Marinobacter excellens HL-55]
MTVHQYTESSRNVISGITFFETLVACSILARTASLKRAFFCASCSQNCELLGIACEILGIDVVYLLLAASAVSHSEFAAYSVMRNLWFYRVLVILIAILKPPDRTVRRFSRMTLMLPTSFFTTENVRDL